MVVVVEFEPRWLMKGLKRSLYKTFNDFVKDFAKKFQNPFNYILDAFARLFNGFCCLIGLQTHVLLNLVRQCRALSHSEADFPLLLGFFAGIILFLNPAKTNAVKGPYKALKTLIRVLRAL